MNAVLTGCVAMVIISVGAYMILGEVGLTAAEQFSNGNVRLD